MNYFFQIIGVITTIIFSIYLIERIIYKFQIIVLVKKWYYRFLYQNYEIWFISKRMTKDECIKFLNDFKIALDINRVHKNDRNLKRFEKAILIRLESFRDKKII